MESDYDTDERPGRKRAFFEENGKEPADDEAGSESPPKLGVEGSVQAVRQCIFHVLSNWWTAKHLRQELEEALEHLRFLETELWQQKSSISNCEEKAKSSLEELREELQVGKTKSISRRWLVETFTEGHGLSSSRRSSAVSDVTPMSPRSSLKAAASEASDAAADEDIADVADSTDIMIKLNSETEAYGLLEGVGKLDCDVVALSELPGMQGHLLQALLQKACQHTSLLAKMEESGAVFEGEKFSSSLNQFLHKMEETYRPDVPYHTAIHAADVMMTMEWFLRSQAIVSQFTDVDHLMALVSCAIHDVGHPGRNNLFHSKTLSPLAITYNDKSILENMHVATAFEVMAKDAKLNWLSLLSTEFTPAGKDKPTNLQQQMRRGMIEIVLGTDMAKHNQHQKSLNGWVANKASGEGSPEAFTGDKLELLEALVHAADVSNPCKPHRMMLYWTQRVIEEFWAQGDEESRLSVEISPMCDRAVGELSIPKQQIGFIDFVIAPFYRPLAELLPEVKEATDNLTENRAFWQSKAAEEATFCQLFGPAEDEV